jgi:mono/diheme cytochrome c family protein/uncharacterized membrane protein
MGDPCRDKQGGVIAEYVQNPTLGVTSNHREPKISHHHRIKMCVRNGLLFLISLGGRQLSAPPEVRAQAASSPVWKDSAPDPSAPKATKSQARALFEKHCAKCHGKDGTGSEARDSLPKIPNFTDASWQRKSKDAQLLASILEGKGAKGEEMPSWRGKVSEEQARGLVSYVRSFAPNGGRSRQGQQKGATSADPAEAKAPRGRFEKMIRWLGNFHPPAVHFPIALLTAAAVAELLRMATGKPEFDAITRYCVWFGTLTAVVAGVLGWSLGGFRLTDASWVMMTHRWLGTSTVACAGLVLVLSELSRRPDRRRTRMCFRGMLLVVTGLVTVTGFFGGAVVFGLDHYAWPQ